MSETLHTAEEWQNLFKDFFEILDPDGWDRNEDFHEVWYNDKITAEEFVGRALQSTCMYNVSIVGLENFIKERLEE